MVRIRLMRMGMKGQPSYRVVIADSRSPRDGRFIENIGWYNPLTEPSTIKIDAERAKYWLSKGAQPSESVDSLLRRAGIKERKTAEAGATTLKAPRRAPRRRPRRLRPSSTRRLPSNVAITLAKLAGSSSESQNACGEDGSGQRLAALVKLSPMKQEPGTRYASAYNGKFWRTVSHGCVDRVYRA